MASADASDNGEAAERWAAREFDLLLTDERWWDAEDAQGNRYQIKACQRWIQNGYRAGQRRQTRGRYKLYENDHESLLEFHRKSGGLGAMYLFIVYDDPTDIQDPLYGFRTPQKMTPLLDWYDIAHGRPGKGRMYRLSWPHVFPEAADA